MDSVNESLREVQSGQCTIDKVLETLSEPKYTEESGQLERVQELPVISTECGESGKRIKEEEPSEVPPGDLSERRYHLHIIKISSEEMH